MLLEGGYQSKLPNIHTTVAMSILNVHNLQNLILTIVADVIIMTSYIIIWLINQKQAGSEPRKLVVINLEGFSYFLLW